MKIRNILKPLSTIILIILIWIYISHIELFNQFILPPPDRVLNTFINMLVTGELFTNIAISLQRVFLGFVIAFITAFITALVFFRIPKLYPFFSFIIEFMRNVPPLALIPLLILWFGIGENTKIILIILASFFPIFLNIEKGFRSTDKHLIEVGQTLGFSQHKIFYKIVLPYALEDILIGSRIGLGLAWRAIIAAEMVAAASGLGHMILFAQQMSRSDKIIIGIIVIGLIGYLCDYLFKLLIDKYIREARNYE